MNLFKKAFTIGSLLVLMVSCKTKVDSNNASVFTKFSPTSKEYKDELANKIQSEPNELNYTFNSLVEDNGNHYLDVSITGDDFEAKSLVLVNNWTKLEGIKRTNGMSYSGAELKGLKLEVVNKQDGAQLIYNGLEQIID